MESDSGSRSALSLVARRLQLQHFVEAVNV